jgi:hypothetical protein
VSASEVRMWGRLMADGDMTRATISFAVATILIHQGSGWAWLWIAAGWAWFVLGHVSRRAVRPLDERPVA